MSIHRCKVAIIDLTISSSGYKFPRKTTKITEAMSKMNPLKDLNQRVSMANIQPAIDLSSVKTKVKRVNCTLVPHLRTYSRISTTTRACRSSVPTQGLSDA